MNRQNLGKMVNPLLLKLLGGVLSCLLLTEAYAQSPAHIEEIIVNGEAGHAYKIQQTSSATKTDTLLRDIPQSISIVTAEQTRDQSAQGLAEALRYIPGVSFAQGEGNRETPIFRGISTTGDFFVDAVRDDIQYYRDLYNIERVEVFRGPNAMIFGRGATGGLINRVTKTPSSLPHQSGSLTFGSHTNRRVIADINQPVNDTLAVRVNGLYENSESYREGVWLKRKGIAPSASWQADANTMLQMNHEHFEDDRIADRGISSYQGKPLKTSASTFFGTAEASPTWSRLDAVSGLIEHDFANGLTLRNRSRWAVQDKFYQNVFAGNVNAAGTSVAISAYNNAMSRKNLFNQTDLILPVHTGKIEHTLLTGVELGEQDTKNLRTTGFFAGNLASVTVPLSSPVTPPPVTYRPNATDANNNGTSTIAAVYAQDQARISSHFQILAGLRYDRFKMNFKNNRTGQTFNITDEFISPRVGVIYNPLETLSLYANYSLANQPRAGDQLSSLTLANANLKPEKFNNYELGAKWDIADDMAATASVFRLDRTNVIVLDPTDPTNTRTILSDGQRTKGVELDLTGQLSPNWSIAGGYAYSDARFTANTSTSLRAGARVGQTPEHTFSLWNRYDVLPRLGAGLGIVHIASRFAANELIATVDAPIPNVTLPAYTRVDAALLFKINESWQAQLNVENVLNENYFISANSNTNITPGSPRSLRASVNVHF